MILRRNSIADSDADCNGAAADYDAATATIATTTATHRTNG